MGREFLRVVSIDEALNVILRVAESVSREISAKKERVHLSEALGRISAEDLHAPFDIPPFDRATVDGYAVIAEDTFYAEEDAPAVLSLRGELRAGEVPKVSVQRGTCVAISTGAPMPAGADAVVKVENTELAEKSGSGGGSGGSGGSGGVGAGERRFVVGEEGEGSEKVKVKIFKPVVPAENVQRAGSDIRKGERILAEGTLLTPRETGMLAACGFSEVLVRKKVKVGVLSTGNEIVSVDHTKLPPGKIYDVNMRTISDAVRLCGCVPVQLGVAPDDFDEIEARLKFQQSSSGEVDVFVVSGGTSAGAGDIVPAVLERNGEILVHGVDIKPGKPFAFGIFSGKPLFALPGNPTSALLSFSLFVAPFLKRISAANTGTAERVEGKCMKARTSQRIISEKGRNEFVFVRLERSSGGEMLATPILKGSGAVSTLASADGYILVEKGREIVEAGETVEIRLLTPDNFPFL
ncbi:MAG: molybdopterin-binding protein [Candidatus Methanospirare jalkutatii]|nr:molybdopterin-binding protein [Candidatus Methanospirare jalkutatii]